MSILDGVYWEKEMQEQTKPQIDKDEYISAICVHGKTYKLRCEVVEIYPITCPKCGASFELRYGSGKCDHCGTNYTTQFKLREV